MYGIVLLAEPEADPSASNPSSTGVILYEEFRRLVEFAAPQWTKKRLLVEGEPHSALSGIGGAGPILRESADELCAEFIVNQQLLPNPADRLRVRRIIHVLQSPKCFQF